MYTTKTKNIKVQDFSMSEYEHYIEEFPSDLTLGETLDSDSAKKKAEETWIKIYGEKIKKENQPYKVYFDSTNNTWLIVGSTPKTWPWTSYIGGVPYIIIQKSDGKVLAVWHDR